VCSEISLLSCRSHVTANAGDEIGDTVTELASIYSNYTKASEFRDITSGTAGSFSAHAGYAAKLPAKFTIPANDGDDTLVPAEDQPSALAPWQRVLS
jgi:hypothetical protein